MVDIPLETRGKRPQFFEDAASDKLMAMMLELMAEVWTLKERLYVVERVAGGKAGLGDKVEAYVCSEAEQAALDAARQVFISNTLRVLGSGSETVKTRGEQVDQLTEIMKKEIAGD